MRLTSVGLSISLLLLLSACSGDPASSDVSTPDMGDVSDAAEDSAEDPLGDLEDDQGGDLPDILPDSHLDAQADAQADAQEPLPDRDEDGVPDDEDLFPDDPCEATDMDGDEIGDAADPDRDGDGVLDRWERRVGTSPNDPADFPDETDTDGDGVPDYRDPFPQDINRWLDLDGDGLDDDEDPDDDNDLIPDVDEIESGGDPIGLVSQAACAVRHTPGWYPGDFHSHTTYSDGVEDIETWVAIHEYYEDPRFLAAHPEYEGRGLRYQAITDHRTIDGVFDPNFHSHELALVPGEEAGGRGHSNALDILTRIDHMPWNNEPFAEIMARAVEQVHWQGGTLQANHPTNPDHAWTTPTDDLDAIEVWNAPWAAIRAMTEDDLNREAAGRGEENPYIRPAVRQIETSANHQALRLWELMLTAGVYVAPVGGTDRHALLPPGAPATWVWAERLTHRDILDGVRARHTIITRNLGALRLEVTLAVEGDEAEYWVGDEVALPANASVTLTAQVEHGAGSVIQVVGAPLLADPTREALLAAPQAEILLTHTIPDGAEEPYVWTTDVTPHLPGWLYVRMLEPIDLDDLSSESVEMLEDTLETLRQGVEDTADMAAALVPLLNVQELIGSIPCEEANWTLRDELNFECFLVDQSPLYTFLLPEQLDLVLSFWGGSAPDGDWAMGALTSAFVFHEP